MIGRRTLGRTGIDVSEVGFGAAEMGYEAVGERVAAELLSTVLDAGVNLIDTAECYGESEELIGRVLAGRRNDFHLLTKCGHASGLPTPDWSQDTLKGNLERSLKRLRTDRVDILLLHSCSEAQLREGAVIEPLLEARTGGKTRFIGYSGDAEALRAAVEIDAFDIIELSVNVADQQAIDSALPEATKRGLGVIAKRPIANAAWKLRDRPPSEYARPYFVRLQQLRYRFQELDTPQAVATALAFTLSVPGIHSAVMGTKSPERLRQNLEIAAEWQRWKGEYEAIRARWTEVAKKDWIGQT
jgi:aryl-alcohol dehydrogenase-like predicted oxidoreductase